MNSTYEVFAIRYGTRTGAKSEIFLNYHVYGEPDQSLEMDYYVWVARNDERTVLIDTGFGTEGGTKRNRTFLVDPLDALDRMGVPAATVPQVIVTHAHYDHIGNLARFPAAEVVMSRRELEFWTGPYGERAQFAWAAEASETAYLRQIQDEGRATLIDRAYSPAPGIEVVPVGGHTPGQVIVLVSTAEGQAVLASDSVHYYEEIERDRPFAFVADLEAMYRAFDLLTDITAEPGRALVAGHDPDVMRRFAPYEVDLGPGAAVRIG